MSRHVTLQQGETARALAERVARTLSELSGVELTVREAEPSPEVGWLLEAVGDAPSPRRMAVGLTAADAMAIARRVQGDAVTEDQVESALSELWLACLEGFGADGQGTWTRRIARAESAPNTWAAAYRVEGPAESGVTVVVSIDLGRADDANPDCPQVQMAGRVVAPMNLDLILDIDLPLAVRFGGTDMTIDALTRLGPGTLIDLGRSPDEPVDVLVNGRTVARGEVVVVAGNYGVRVTEVVSAADRLRSIGM